MLYDNELPLAHAYFKNKGWTVQPFQEVCWQHVYSEKSGLLNAPTGSGKTYALMIPFMLLASKVNTEGLFFIWITPLRALAEEIKSAAQKLMDDLQLNLSVGIRTGDTSGSDRAKQKKSMPHLLITTPESLHLMLATKGYDQIFKNLHAVIVDEWHELLGSKRGVQVELALSRLKAIAKAQNRQLQIWGISATIGNLDEAMQILHGYLDENLPVLVKADIKKEIEIATILPDIVEKYPWSGHLGIHLLEKVIPLIQQSASVLIFTNTRSQSEIWYKTLLEKMPELSGLLALHHASLDKEIRLWVENALHEGKLKAVVCTSSLDLGVDFRPVDTIIQVGSPKGIARFLQRAGRSGHQPGAVSKIYFLPTNSLEILEGAALRNALKDNKMEQRIPYIRSFDVLIQYLVTLAVSDGFESEQLLKEVQSTFSFNSLTLEEWNKILVFITQGGTLLDAYEEFKKVEIVNGKYIVRSRATAMRHRLSIGTIVSDNMLNVKLLGGGSTGAIEEWFVSKLNPGDVFWFAGRSLELVRIKEMTVQVRLSNSKNGLIPAWMGGRMPMSSNLGDVLREELFKVHQKSEESPEYKALFPLFELQQQLSSVPNSDEFLVEYFESKDGFHLMFYPFEGRFVHEGLGALLAYRLASHIPISFSIAMNDYGFELLSDTFIQPEEWIHHDLFSTEHLHEDILASVNAAEMARRKFRDIASIAGLVFQGFLGKYLKNKQLQASSQLFFNVFYEHEPSHLLLQQAFEEVMTFQLEETRLRNALYRIQNQSIIIRKCKQPTPFSFPIITDRLRQKLTSEKWEDRVRKMTLKFK